VKSALPPLPELNPIRNNPQTAPELRHRDLLLAFKPLLNLLHPSFELLAPVIILTLRLKHLALSARPRTDPAAPGTRVVVILALLSRDPLHAAFDVDLALQRLPEEEHRCARVGRYVGGLARGAQVSVDDEAAGVELFEVDCAGGDAA
jgi:hypothetical protein